MFNDTPSQPTPVAPSVVAPVQPSSPVPLPEQRPHGVGKKIALAFVVFVMFFALGAVAFTYYRKQLESPERVVPKMLDAMQSATSVSFDGSGAFTGEGTNREAEEIAMDGTLMASGSLAEAQAVVEFSWQATSSDGQEIAFGGEYRQDGDETYVNFTSLPIANTQLADDIAQFEPLLTNRWIAVGKGQVREVLGDAFADQLEALAAASEPSDDEVANAKAAIAGIVLAGIEVTQQLAPEAVSGVETYHYAYRLDKDATVGELERVRTEQEHFMSDDQAEKFTEMLNKLGDITGEVWIGQDDYHVYRLTAASTYEESSDSGRYFANLEGSVDIRLSDYNEEAEVETPEDTSSLVEVVQEVMTAMTERDEQQESDDDADGLSFRDEERYGTDPNNPDTDGDGFADGQEVDGGYDPAGPGKLTTRVDDLMNNTSMTE